MPEAWQSCCYLCKVCFWTAAFFRACAEGTLIGDASKDGHKCFIQSMASSFLEAARELTETSVLPQTGAASTEMRPGDYVSWVVLLRTVVEDSGVDLETIYTLTGAAEDALAVADNEEEEAEGGSPDRWASLTVAQAWAETEIETILDMLIAKKILLEMPDMPFYPGCKVLAILSDDKDWHPAVVLREVAFADMWEDGYTPPQAVEKEEAIAVDAEPAMAEIAVTETSSSAGGGYTVSGAKKSSKKAKPIDIHANWCQNRFFEVRFLEFGKKQFARFSNMMLDQIVEDDEGVDGMACEEGDCEVCRRELFLTFHHLIPKHTHKLWLKRKRLPEGVRGYDSGSRKKLPSSAASDSKKASSKTKAGAKKSSQTSKSSPRNGKDENCNRYFLNTYGIMVCRQCHSQIHLMACNMELAKRYNTLERVLNAPLMQRRVGWKK